MNLIRITEPGAPELDLFRSVTEAQLRRRSESAHGIFIAESPKVIATALRTGHRPIALLTEEKHIGGDAADIIAQCGDIPVYTGDRAVLSSLTGYTLTRGVLCAMARPQPADTAEVCDTTNIGAIFRSAAALGVDAVLLSPTSCDPLNRRSIRVSMGSVFLIPWAFLPADYMPELKRLGFTTAAMALRSDSVNIDDPALAAAPRLAVILGTEGNGLSDAVINQADHVVMIPMAHTVDSLNVAAASAVAFYQLGRR